MKLKDARRDVMKCPKCGSEMIPAENLFVCPDCKLVLKQVGNCATDADRKDDVAVDDGQNERILSEYTAKKLAEEEQKAREEAERKAHDEAIKAEIAELNSQVAELKSQISAKKKEIAVKAKQLSPKAQNDKKKGAVNLVRDSVVLLVCVILFALSFCPVMAIEVDSLLSQAGVRVEGADIGLSTIDYITLMSATTNSYESYADADEKLVVKTEDALVALQEHISISSSSSKATIDKEGNAILHKFAIYVLELEVGLESFDGTADEAKIIVSGVLSLIYILFATAMLVVAFINFLFTLLKKKKDMHTASLAMIPAYLVFSILLVFMCPIPLSKVAGAMITAMVFCALAIAGTIAYTVISAKKGTRVALIPKFVSALIVVIVMACAFAPAFTVTADIMPEDLSSRREYSYDISLSALCELIIRDDVNIEDLSVQDDITNSLKDETYSPAQLKSDMATEVATVMLIGCMHDYEEYKEISALSLGYWLMILVGIAGSISVGAIFASANGKKTGGLDLAMKILMIVFIVGMLVCCIIGLVYAQDTLNEYYDIPKSRASFGIGGGVITMLIFSILAIVNDCVGNSLVKRKNNEVENVKNDDYVAPIAQENVITEG